MVAWTGTDANHPLNVTSTKPFPNWPDPVTTLRETRPFGPALVFGVSAAVGQQMILGWTGTGMGTGMDAAHHLNIATTSFE